MAGELSKSSISNCISWKTKFIIPFFLLNHAKQGSDIWKSWRNAGVGASDAPTIMGGDYSIWESVEELAYRKQSFPDNEPVENDRMKEAVDQQRRVRRRFEKFTGQKFYRFCLQHKELSWLKASLNGISLDFSRAIEIKCNRIAYQYAEDDHIAPQYIPKLQHIMALTDLQEIEFIAWLPDEEPIVLKLALLQKVCFTTRPA